jgi:hypothetical protein
VTRGNVPETHFETNAHIFVYLGLHVLLVQLRHNKVGSAVCLCVCVSVSVCLCVCVDFLTARGAISYMYTRHSLTSATALFLHVSDRRPQCTASQHARSVCVRACCHALLPPHQGLDPMHLLSLSVCMCVCVCVCVCMCVCLCVCPSISLPFCPSVLRSHFSFVTVNDSNDEHSFIDVHSKANIFQIQVITSRILVFVVGFGKNLPSFAAILPKIVSRVFKIVSF